MKILITGSSGFLGRYLIRHLVSVYNNQVTLFGLFHSAEEKILPLRGNCRYIHGDILNSDTISTIIKQIKPDGIIHLSGVVKGSFHNMLQVNVEGTAILCEAVRETRSGCRILFVSSSAVYGDAGDQLIPEETNPQPVSFYGISKISGEYLVQQYSHFLHFPVTIIRPFNLIGPGLSSQFIAGDLVRQGVRIIQSEQEEIVIRSLKGKRDYVDVRDVAKVLSDIIVSSDFNDRFAGNIFNVGSGKDHSIPDLIETLSLITKMKLQVRVTDPDAIEMVPTQRGDCSKIYSAMGWKPTYSLAQSLSDMIKFEIHLGFA